MPVCCRPKAPMASLPPSLIRIIFSLSLCPHLHDDLEQTSLPSLSPRFQCTTPFVFHHLPLCIRPEVQAEAESKHPPACPRVFRTGPQQESRDTGYLNCGRFEIQMCVDPSLSPTMSAHQPSQRPPRLCRSTTPWSRQAHSGQTTTRPRSYKFCKIYTMNFLNTHPPLCRSSPRPSLW